MARQDVYLICYALIIIKKKNKQTATVVIDGHLRQERSCGKYCEKNHLMTLCFKKHNRYVSK